MQAFHPAAETLLRLCPPCLLCGVQSIFGVATVSARCVFRMSERCKSKYCSFHLQDLTMDFYFLRYPMKNTTK